MRLIEKLKCYFLGHQWQTVNEVMFCPLCKTVKEEVRLSEESFVTYTILKTEGYKD